MGIIGIIILIIIYTVILLLILEKRIFAAIKIKKFEDDIKFKDFIKENKVSSGYSLKCNKGEVIIKIKPENETRVISYLIGEGIDFKYS